MSNKSDSNSKNSLNNEERALKNRAGDHNVTSATKSYVSTIPAKSAWNKTITISPDIPKTKTTTSPNAKPVPKPTNSRSKTTISSLYEQIYGQVCLVLLKSGEIFEGIVEKYNSAEISLKLAQLQSFSRLGEFGNFGAVKQDFFASEESTGKFEDRIFSLSSVRSVLCGSFAKSSISDKSIFTSDEEHAKGKALQKELERWTDTSSLSIKDANIDELASRQDTSKWNQFSANEKLLPEQDKGYAFDFDRFTVKIDTTSKTYEQDLEEAIRIASEIDGKKVSNPLVLRERRSVEAEDDFDEAFTTDVVVASGSNLLRAKEANSNANSSQAKEDTSGTTINNLNSPSKKRSQPKTQQEYKSSVYKKSPQGENDSWQNSPKSLDIVESKNAETSTNILTQDMNYVQKQESEVTKVTTPIIPLAPATSATFTAQIPASTTITLSMSSGSTGATNSKCPITPLYDDSDIQNGFVAAQEINSTSSITLTPHIPLEVKQRYNNSSNNTIKLSSNRSSNNTPKLINSLSSPSSNASSKPSTPPASKPQDNINTLNITNKSTIPSIVATSAPDNHSAISTSNAEEVSEETQKVVDNKSSKKLNASAKEFFPTFNKEKKYVNNIKPHNPNPVYESYPYQTIMQPQPHNHYNQHVYPNRHMQHTQQPQYPMVQNPNMHSIPYYYPPQHYPHNQYYPHRDNQ